MRLTKQQLERLNTALSVDEMLYEKFRRLQEQLRRDENRAARKSRIRQIIRLRPDGVREVLQIRRIFSDLDGLVIEVS